MGHLLATVNPKAADAIGHEYDVDLPIPDIGDTVVFHPRVGEWRAGRNKFAAIVTWVHDDGTLDLVVFYDADDFIGQRNVPRREGEGRGWELPRGDGPQILNIRDAPMDDMRDRADILAEIRDQLPRVMEQVFGPCVAEPPSIMETLMDVKARLTALENRPKPGRPKKPAPQG